MYVLSKQSNLEMSASSQKMLSSLCEVGWLYRMLSLHMNKLSVRGASLTVQSFAMAVRDQLSQYYKYAHFFYKGL